MKQSKSVTLPIEVPGTGIEVMKMKITVSVDSKMLPFLKSLGLGEEHLPNYITSLLEEAKDAVDGSVRGVIVSNMEEL